MELRKAILQTLCVIGLLQILVIGVMATPINFGDTVTGTISTLAQMNEYTFIASKGDTIYTRMSSNWSNGPKIILKDQYQTEIATDYRGGSFAEITKILPSTGPYTLLVGDVVGSKTGTYGLYLQRTNNSGQAETINFGETKTGYITKPAQLNNYTFIASKGDTIYTRMSSNWSNGPHLRLYAPNGTEIATDYRGGSFAEITKILPLTGPYTLLAGDVVGSKTGTYGLYLQRTNNSGLAEPIASGETKMGSITKPAQLNTYTFMAAKGGTIYTRMSSSWSNGPHLRLYAPNGTEIATDYRGGSFAEINKENLPLTGPYTLLAGDVVGSKTGTYGLYLHLSGDIPTILITSPNGGETWQRGTSHKINWSYTGSPGSTVKIVLLKAGAEVGTINASTSIGSDGSGSYTWAISPTGSTGSDYKVKVQSISQPAVNDLSNNNFTITPPAITSSITVTSPNGGETWQRGTSHKINWSYTGSPGSSVKIVLLKADAEVGTIITSTSVGSGGSGSYTWAISPTGSTGSDYKVKVQSISQPAVNDMSNTKFNITSAVPVCPLQLSFETNVTSGTAPFAVQFKDTSVGSPTRWNWSFGDGTWYNTTIAGQKNPVHIYSKKGNFPATLTVCNAIGCDTTIPGILAR